MMLIESVEMFHVRMRLVSPFKTSFGIEHDRDCIILRLESEGLVGWGECVASNFPGYSYETIGTAWHILSDYFIPAVLGKRVSNAEEFTELYAHYKGHRQARAGIEMALWDLIGKASGRSLASLLGGQRSSVPVGVSVGIQPDERRLIEVIEGYLKAGYQRIKLKIKPGRDLGELQSVRRAFPDLKLQVDANSAYRLQDQATFVAMDPLDLLMIEQPLAEDDLIDHSILQKSISTPLCLDESIRTARHARQAIEIDACRVINIKAGRVGGLVEAKAVHDVCKEQSVPVWCGGMLETGIGRAANLALASLPGFTLPGDISASDRYYLEDIAEPRFTLNSDSTIDVPDGHGLGVNVIEEALEKVTLRRESFRAKVN
jgi:O-succinylbenzoate synthase